MKLYIDQKVFSWNDSFTIKDQKGRVKYTAKGSVMKIGKELDVKDTDGNLVVAVDQKLLSLMPQYHLIVDGRKIGKLEKKVSLLKPKFRVDELDWDITGNFTGHSYEINQNKKEIATVKKEYVSWGDAYELNIHDPDDELTALAVILAIDCAMDDD